MDQLIEKVSIEEFGEDPRPCIWLVTEPQELPDLELDEDDFPF